MDFMVSRYGDFVPTARRQPRHLAAVVGPFVLLAGASDLVRMVRFATNAPAPHTNRSMRAQRAKAQSLLQDTDSR